MRLPLGIRNSILCSLSQPFQIEKVVSSQQRSCQVKLLEETSLLLHSFFPLSDPSSWTLTSVIRSRNKMPRPSGTLASAWNEGMTWGEQTIEYNRTIVDYLNMDPSFKQAYHKQVIFPIISSLGGYESKRRSTILSRILRHGDRIFPTNDSGRYCA
eukprot:1674446-Amphidinium_carterae.1